MTITEMRKLSDEDLLEISKRKTRKGIHTREADLAMSIRRERAGHWDDVPTRAPGNERMDAVYDGYTSSERYD